MTVAPGPARGIGEATRGLVGVVQAAWGGPVPDESLEAWLLARLRQTLNSAKQWAQARLGEPRGL